MSYTTKDIRNVCLLGHGGSGKTTLTENMLYLTGAIDRQGKVNDGNTVCDYDAEEIKRQVTISAAIAPISFGGKKINVIDCPGFQDFAGEVAAALRAEYHAADGHITVTVTETDDGLTPMDAASTERAITLLLCAPNGVVEMSMDVPGLVQTSLNLGRLTSDEASLRASFMIRSSINS